MTYTYGRHNTIKLCRLSVTKILLMCLLCTIVMTCFVAVSPITKDECVCATESVSLRSSSISKNVQESVKKTFPPSKHKLAVLVPYRDRFEELLEFAPYIHKFLLMQNVDHHIYVLNQVDQYRFNRASLINVGFRESSKECDYIAMHDVDLLPLNPGLSYHYPEAGPFHVASPQFHPRYHYPTFVGGILLVKREDFEQVNGMSNKYWGWGLEDDEFYVRLKEARLVISRPANISTGPEDTFRHLHDRNRRKRDMAKCFDQRAVTRRRDRQTGLADVSYTVRRTQQLMVDGAPVTILHVALRCNHRLTPWCECMTDATAAVNSSVRKKPVSKTL